MKDIVKLMIKHPFASATIITAIGCAVSDIIHGTQTDTKYKKRKHK